MPAWNRFFLWAIGLLLCSGLHAQRLDRVIAVIDDDIITESELDAQMKYMMEMGEKDDGTLKCTVFEKLLTNKLLLCKAKLDSLNVGNDQIEGELNRRLAYMIQQMQGVENLEKVYKKSLLEIKMELKPKIEEQLLIEQQKSTIYGKVKVTPRDVKQYFAEIPADSIPYLPAEVEIAHIVIKPKPSAERKKEAYDKLAEYRKLIATGKAELEALARNSDDGGSAKQGGSLGEFGRGDMVPEFEEVVYNLQVGQLSEIFETDFGYHIVRLNKKIGDRVDASHILIRPRVSSADEKAAQAKLIEIAKMVQSDSITFYQAAARYSDDKATSVNGGMMSNSTTGELRLPIDMLDADLFFKIDQLKPGEISEPVEMYIQEGEIIKAYRIILLKSRTAAHKANLKVDYQKFYNAAQQSRRSTVLKDWFDLARKQVHIEIKDHSCDQALRRWVDTAP